MNSTDQQSIYNIITTSQGKLTAIYPALLAVINNISAYLEHLSPAVSAKLLQLFTSMSSPGFLLANDSNHDLLHSLLESMNSIIEHQYISQYIPLLSASTVHPLGQKRLKESLSKLLIEESRTESLPLYRNEHDAKRLFFPT